MDPALLKDAIIPRAKYIPPVHLFGQMADSAIEKAAKLLKALSLTEDVGSRFCQQLGPTFCPILFGSSALLFVARSPWMWFD